MVTFFSMIFSEYKNVKFNIMECLFKQITEFCSTKIQSAPVNGNLIQSLLPSSKQSPSLSPNDKSSFILKTALNKEFRLTKHGPIENNENIFLKVYKYIFKSQKQDESNQKHWYYVHFFQNDISKIPVHLDLHPDGHLI